VQNYNKKDLTNFFSAYETDSEEKKDFGLIPILMPSVSSKRTKISPRGSILNWLGFRM
jgi:hypothetical protein